MMARAKRIHNFGDNPDIVTKVEVEYHRTAKIKPNFIPEGATWEYVTWDYNEKLSIDRETETMEHFRELGSGCKIINRYYVEEGISSFLDDIDVNVFSITNGNPSEAVDDPMDVKNYTITIYNKHGNTRIVAGSFDKDGLPADWPEFISNVYEFMAFYGIGELFDEDVYDI